MFSEDGFAFSDCTNLTSIAVEDGNLIYDSRNNCNAIIETSTNTLIYGCKNTHTPSSITAIRERAFFNCNSLTSITIPNSVTSIGRWAFSGCTSLTSVTIGNSVTRIDGGAFSDCVSLTSITIPNSVTDIGRYDYDYYYESPFSQCPNLSSIIVESGNGVYDSRDNCNAIIETAINTLIQGCTTTIIPNSVTCIGYGAFEYCNGLTSITIPSNVTHIGEYAFCNCDRLKTIFFQSQTSPRLEFMGAYGEPTAFQDCIFDTVYVPCGAKGNYSWCLSYMNVGRIIGYCDAQQLYSILVSSIDSTFGQTTSNFEGCDEWTISATANLYYQFSHWSDGNKDNPRVLTVTQDTTLIAYFVPATSGKCGDNLYWSYKDDTLSITGTGDMYDYQADSANASPWLLFRDSITTITFPEGMVRTLSVSCHC